MAKNAQSWSKDNPGPGRKAGVPNQLTKTVKETVLEVFNKLQQEGGVWGLESFAEKYPRDFYAIAAKLIPTEIQAKVKSTIQLQIVRDTANTIPHSEFTPESENGTESTEKI